MFCNDIPINWIAFEVPYFCWHLYILCRQVPCWIYISLKITATSHPYISKMTVSNPGMPHLYCPDIIPLRFVLMSIIFTQERWFIVEIHIIGLIKCFLVYSYQCPFKLRKGKNRRDFSLDRWNIFLDNHISVLSNFLNGIREDTFHCTYEIFS